MNKKCLKLAVQKEGRTEIAGREKGLGLRTQAGRGRRAAAPEVKTLFPMKFH